MAVTNVDQLLTPISQRQFELYALSLERGPNFSPAQIFRSYQAKYGVVAGRKLTINRGEFRLKFDQGV